MVPEGRPPAQYVFFYSKRGRNNPDVRLNDPCRFREHDILTEGRFDMDPSPSKIDLRLCIPHAKRMYHHRQGTIII